MELTGSAVERLAQLDEIIINGAATDEWLTRHLRVALREVAELEALADEEQDRREDY
jgi:hypothetical protein